MKQLSNLKKTCARLRRCTRNRTLNRACARGGGGESGADVAVASRSLSELESP